MTLRRLFTGLPLLALAACSTPDASPSASGKGERAVSVFFVLIANGKPAGCGVPLGPLGSRGTPATLHDARFYVQDAALIDRAGRAVPLTLAAGEWQSDGVALIDFEDASAGCAGGTKGTNSTVTGSVPAGEYVGLSFKVGVPPALNHTSTERTPAPLDIAAMGWSWQAGRKFVKLEVDPAGGIAKPDRSRAPTWYVHLGSTGCTGNPATGETVACERSNRIPVRVAAFDPATQAVALDLTALFQGSDLTRDQGGAVGCMSGPTDPDCGAVFGRFGLSLKDGKPLEDGRSPVFSVVAKR